jgi:Zn-dependent peptidase ImmA (M78 family)
MKLHNFDVWSAITLKKDDLYTIIINSDHSEARKESDLFHELAHIICGHKMLGFELVGNVHLRKYNQEQEDEAEWLGGCLHIPRKSLEWAFRNKMTPPDICTYYTASNEMLTYRINVTGIKNQYKYYANKYLIF